MRRRRRRPRKPGGWLWLSAAIVYPLDSLLFRMRWQHLDRMPASGGVIIAINHISHLDPPLMARLVWESGRVPRFMVKHSLFAKPVFGRILVGAKQVPVVRGSADAANSLAPALAALDQGEALLIYPEGTITKDPAGWPMRGKTGLARLVLQRPGVPVVPVGQWGVQHGTDKRRRRTSYAIVGRPLDLSEFAGREPDEQTLREITEAVMAAIRDLVAELRPDA